MLSYFLFIKLLEIKLVGLVFGTLKSELIQNPNVLNGISKPNHSKSEQNVHHFVQILNGLDNLSTICNPNAFQNTNALKHFNTEDDGY